MQKNLIYYEIHESKQPHTHTLILIHGNRISRRYWQSFEKELANQNQSIRTMVVDLRGFGKSAHMNTINSLEDFSNDVHNVIQHVAQEEGLTKQQVFDTFTLCGWSLGGLVTNIAAMQFPEWYQRIILVSPAPFDGYPIRKLDQEGQITIEICDTKEEVLSQKNIKRGIDAIQNQDLTFFRSLYPIWYNKGPIPSLEDREEIIVDALLQTNYSDLTWLLHQYDLNKYNPHQNLQGPILLYHGREDAIVPLSRSQDMIKFIGEVRVEFIIKDELGHMPPTAIPKEFATVVIDFLKKHVQL